MLRHETHMSLSKLSFTKDMWVECFSNSDIIWTTHIKITFFDPCHEDENPAQEIARHKAYFDSKEEISELESSMTQVEGNSNTPMFKAVCD